MYFYKSDSQESDIEWLFDPSSESHDGTPQLWFTNQAVSSSEPKTYTSQLPPSDATTAEHEYRLDWTADSVQWFIDGNQVWEATSNVPSQPGSWLWNNWSDGGIGWTAGPPASDALFKISKIEMYYNTA